jgi:hypothetical protein
MTKIMEGYFTFKERSAYILLIIFRAGIQVFQAVVILPKDK